MTTLNETIVWGSFVAPLNTVVASAVVAATEAGGAVVTAVLTPGETVATLTLTAGTWTVTAQAMDANSAPVGPAAVDATPYVVTVVTTVTVQIPTGLSGVLV